MEFSKIRSDLVIENLEMAKNQIQPNDIRVKEFTSDDMKISEVIITKEQEQFFNKKSGTYITIDTSSIVDNDHEALLRIQKQIAKHIDTFFQKHNIHEDDLGMIVGLGNDSVTPDALGPKVIENIFVTKHLFDLHPEQIDHDGFRPVCAIAPGVMGNTGLETYEIINSVIKSVKPKFVIVVDALAARAINRVNKTIQLSDAGISPGSGVGNKRKEISFDTTGIPVISVGVPTVVDAVTITSDTIEMIIKHIGYSMQNIRPANRIVPTSMSGRKDYSKIDKPENDVVKNIFGEVGLMSPEEKQQLIFEVLSPQGLNMMVTPKEIDTNIEDLTHIISRGINLALHKNIS
ncbi:MAG: endopeptidase [Haloplasmataceae bacterium]|nr:endopeptidase [Haloplasmataceae bacterium]